MPTIKVNNIDCYYEIHGQGKPLLLIAGLGSDSQSWEPALTELTRHYKVIVFDNRGIGRTNYPNESFDISTLAKDSVGLMDELKINQANILGHSMGGYIAQEIALNYPQRVNKLILASTATITSERNKFLFTNLLRFLEEGISYELFLKEFLFWIFAPEFFTNKENFDSIMKYLLDYPYPITLEGFKKQTEAVNNFKSLGRVEAETLIMAGKKDILITPEETENLATRINKAQLVFLKNAAHSIHIEETKNFIKHMVDFLK